MIKAIIFDCFGVLTTDLWKEFCAALPESAGLKQAHDLNHAYDAGLISREAFLEGVHEATGKLPQEIEQVLDNDINKNAELLAYIAKLKRQYKIGLLSNVGTNWIRDSFLTPNEQALFDVFVFSFEAGTTKPDPRIFQLTAERLGVLPNECVMIDDIDRYAEAAKATGMQAIVYQNFQQMKRDLAVFIPQQV